MHRNGEDLQTVRIRFKTATALFESFPEARDDITAEPSETPTLPFVEGLLAGPVPEEAVTFCAYLLERRDAVWWGGRCLRRSLDILPPGSVALLDVAEAWAREPDEERRLAALAAGHDAADRTPVAWLALAAGWSGGNMMLEAGAYVPAPAHMTARGVNVALLGTVARVGSAARQPTLRAFVDMAYRVIDGSDLPPDF